MLGVGLAAVILLSPQNWLVKGSSKVNLRESVSGSNKKE